MHLIVILLDCDLCHELFRWKASHQRKARSSGLFTCENQMHRIGDSVFQTSRGTGFFQGLCFLRSSQESFQSHSCEEEGVHAARSRQYRRLPLSPSYSSFCCLLNICCDVGTTNFSGGERRLDDIHETTTLAGVGGMPFTQSRLQERVERQFFSDMPMAC